MRFTSVSIHNFRQYQDIYFDMSKQTAFDLHIIVATNGVGKTNLLNAICWCLYGKETHISGMRDKNTPVTDQLPLCNLAAMEEAESNGMGECEVRVEIAGIDNKDKYVFRRTIKVNPRTHMPIGRQLIEMEITPENGDPRIITTKDEFDAQLDRILPERIQEYFFFDGEQLLNYFSNDKSDISHIRDNIYQIAQVDIVQNAIEHIEIRRNEIRRQINRSEPDLAKISQEMDSIQSRINAKLNEIDTLKDENEKAQREIERLSQHTSGTEGAIKARETFNANVEQIKSLESDKARLMRNMAGLIQKYMPLLMMHGINVSAFHYVDSRMNDSEVSATVTEEQILESLDIHKCIVCGRELNASAEQYMRDIIKTLNSNAALQKMVRIHDGLHRSLDIDGYPTERDNLFEQIDACEEKIEQLTDDNTHLKDRFGKVSNIDQIQQELQDEQHYRDLQDKNNKKIGAYEENVRRFREEYSQKEQDYKNAEAADSTCKTLKNQLDFLTEAKKKAETIRDNIVAGVTSKMESKTMEIFDELMTKKESFDHVALDENFRLQLFSKVNGLPCLHSVSAAEMELLALAFTLSISEVSGFDNLLFIDTPVGRVSDSNRTNFAKTLLEISTRRQLILAFTPSEYSQEIRDVLHKGVASSFTKLTTSEQVTQKGES